MCLGNINKIKKISLWLTPWPLLNLYSSLLLPHSYFVNEREAPKLAATICDPAQIKVCSGGLGGPTVWGRLEVEVGATHTDTDGELQLISTNIQIIFAQIRTSGLEKLLLRLVETSQDICLPNWHLQIQTSSTFEPPLENCFILGCVWMHWYIFTVSFINFHSFVQTT